MDTRHTSRARRLARLAGLALAAGLAAAPAQAFSPGGDGPVQAVAAPTTGEILPVGELRAGMRGVGYTVMRGAEPEAFDAEILGVLHDAYPKQDLVIARLEGLGLERSGVIAGMSGSPVYVDERLVGAVAYRLLSFGHEAIAGIVPIESMLRVAAMDGDRRDRVAGLEPGTVERMLSDLAAHLVGDAPAEPAPVMGEASRGLPGLEPLAMPVTMAGLDPRLVRRITPVFEAYGWMPMIGGALGTGAEVRANFVPGGAVAVELMRGDITVSASGTITYRDGDRILAFGHPFLQGGRVDFPMVAAEVMTVLSGSSASSKLAIAGDEIIGSIRQDRLPAIMGVIGASPDLIPVRMAVDDGVGGNEEFTFEIVSDKLLTPLYLFLGLVNGVQSLDTTYGDSAVEIDANVFLQGQQPLRINNLFSSQNQAIVALSQNLASIFGFLFDNSFEPVTVREVDVDLKLRNDRRTAEITRVWYDRKQVRPGETVTLSIGLRPYRQAEVFERVSLRIPENVRPGTLTVLVGDATAIAREEQTFIQGRVLPNGLPHLVRLLNSIRRSDRIYLQVARADDGALVGGEVMPSLPPSMLEVLSSDRTSGAFVRLTKTVIMEDETAVDYVVTGSHRIELTVRNP